MGFSADQRDRELALVFNQTATGLTHPFTMRLHTGSPGASGTSNGVDTGVWTNYTHETVNTDLTTVPYFKAPVAGTGTRRQVTIEGTVDFGTATIVGTPPVITHISIFDTSGTPKFIASGALTNSKTINNLDPVTVLEDEVVIYREDA